MFAPINCPCGHAHEMEVIELETRHGLADFFRTELLKEHRVLEGNYGKNYVFLRGNSYYADCLFFHWKSHMFKADEVAWTLIRIRTLNARVPSHSSCYADSPLSSCLLQEQAKPAHAATT